jgi:integrase
LFKDYVAQWEANQPTKAHKPNTLKTYHHRLQKRIVPAFGELPVAAIKRTQIKAWVAALLWEGLDFDTAKGYLLTLSGVLTEAVEDGLIVINPALRAGKLLKRPKTVEENDRDLDIFTLEEEQTLLQTAKADDSIIYPMVLTFFRTGMRVGEVLGLHRADVNVSARSITIKRNWTKGHLTTPKNGKSRTVDLSHGLAAALTDWMAYQDLEAAAATQPSPEILFPGNLGGTRQAPSYMAENWLRYKLWFPLLDKAHVRRLNTHATRHTFVSRLIANGENLKYIAEQVGHSSIRVTADIYGHLIPGGNKQAVDRLDAILALQP